jgi:hypothetical protein
LKWGQKKVQPTTTSYHQPLRAQYQPSTSIYYLFLFFLRFGGLAEWPWSLDSKGQRLSSISRWSVQDGWQTLCHCHFADLAFCSTRLGVPGVRNWIQGCEWLFRDFRASPTQTSGIFRLPKKIGNAMDSHGNTPQNAMFFSHYSSISAARWMWFFLVTAEYPTWYSCW